MAGSDITGKSAEIYSNRELSWLAFARRVLALADTPDLPLLERVKFAGIMGMLHDEFFMKRISGLKRQILKRPDKLSIDGRRPEEELQACREELADQVDDLGRVVGDLKRELRAAGIPILDYDDLDSKQQKAMRQYFSRSVLPILTPLAVDTEHPFPFISNRNMNLAVVASKGDGGAGRFVRIKVPSNRPRWVALPDGSGYVPLEQVIAANLDLMLPDGPRYKVFQFRVTRGAEGERRELTADLAMNEALLAPGSIVRLVSSELKARKFAGSVRLQVDPKMPKKTVAWLAGQMGLAADDVYRTDYWLGISDLMDFRVDDRPDLLLPRVEPRTHRRLRDLRPGEPGAIFDEIRRGDLLVHHPYDSFDTSVLRFIESAALDPAALAIKLTIYRTSKDSPIVQALAEAARRGKQVAVLVEITARFDEAPNIAWGEYLEQEGVHVAYGVESLKTHVKLALVVREERGEIRRYAHVGTGNYHTGTARIYEDLGVLTCHPEITEDVAAVFNELTGAVPSRGYNKMLVAPNFMRDRFYGLIQREIDHATTGKRSGIRAKMNQLQDPEMIRELYRAGAAGVPIDLNVRGLCCLRPGLPGISETIRVFGVVGRFLEHSRIYRFENDGAPEYYIGSADWMKRNLTNRVETIMPVLDDEVKRGLEAILDVYDTDNCSVWDCRPDGSYVRRTPAEGEERREAQEIFIRRAARVPEPAASPVSRLV